ncbi:solute carrier family 22 member 2-like, partial [Saccoglossus kowalevskii]|uniref:Solute carrier family 22 member 5-like n=1 Tax=Saccoglossus kowalevskii TaxID=10224 RepID=A0ABM0MEQ6_SACKO
MQHYDDLLKYHLGEFGAFQKRTFFLLSLTVVPIGMKVASFVFILAETDHWCRIPEYDDLIEQCEYINATTDCDLFVKTITIPKEPVSDVCDTTWRFSSCLRYDINTSDVVDLIDVYDNQTLETRTCDSGMEFDTTQYSSTVIQE